MPTKKRPKKRRTRTKASQKVYTEKQWKVRESDLSSQLSYAKAKTGQEKEQVARWMRIGITSLVLNVVFLVASGIFLAR